MKLQTSCVFAWMLVISCLVPSKIVHVMLQVTSEEMKGRLLKYRAVSHMWLYLLSGGSEDTWEQRRHPSVTMSWHVCLWRSVLCSHWELDKSLPKRTVNLVYRPLSLHCIQQHAQPALALAEGMCWLSLCCLARLVSSMWVEHATRCCNRWQHSA